MITKGQNADEGAMIVTFEGYVCGVPYLFNTDANEAFLLQRQSASRRVYSRVCGRITKPASVGSSLKFRLAHMPAPVAQSR